MTNYYPKHQPTMMPVSKIKFLFNFTGRVTPVMTGMTRSQVCLQKNIWKKITHLLYLQKYLLLFKFCSGQKMGLFAANF